MAELIETDRQTAPTPGPGAATLGSGVDYSKFLDCVHCGLCISACPTYLETGNENDSPRGRIYLMRAVTDGRLQMSDTVARHLDLCLDCRSCETACPSGVQYGRLIEPFRVDMRKQEQTDAGREPGGWFQRWILYGLFPYPGRMRVALWPARLAQMLRLDRLLEWSGLLRLLPEKLREMHSLLPSLKARGPSLPELLPAIGDRRARVALFTGCVADAMFHHVHWATARVLQANGCVGGIAGSAASWAGWAAATGTLDILGFLIGFLVFVWTPSHFWCLAMKIKSDYEEANIPMLPVVIGMQRTSKYILVNTLILLPFSLMLYAFGMGLVYIAIATVSGGLMLVYHFQLTKKPTSEFAWKAYKVTAPYLTIIFLGVALDAAFHFRF